MRYIDIRSISVLHEYYKCGKPLHPLVTVIDLGQTHPDRPHEEVFYRPHFYTVFCKRFKGQMKYGKGRYDFDEGTLMFTAPQQVMAISRDIREIQGWGLFFHPDLLHATPLGKKMDSYSFFHYDSNEALHISEEEDQTLQDSIHNIRREIGKNTDRHTQTLIVDHIQLILNYCNRFYDRQFFTRARPNTDIVQRFETLLKEYFAQSTLIEAGIPQVTLFASQLHLSPNYLSDLLNKYTGKTTQEHIHLTLVDKAKNLLMGTEKSISEIGYDLGFEHPSHFTRLFKNKTGRSPKDYRHSTP